MPAGDLVLPDLVVIGATFLLAGFVKGVVGLGLPTVGVGLLSLVMAPAEAAALLIVPSLVTNVWQLLAGPRFGALARRLWPMMAGVCVGTWAGLGVLHRLDLLTGAAATRAAGALGLALMLYAALGLTRVQVPAPGRHEAWLAPLVGGLTGVVTAATGVFAIPAVPYLGALGFGKDEMIQALGLSFTVSTVALALGLAATGVLRAEAAGASMLALAPALLGLAAGGWVRGRVQASTFRLCFLVGLFGLGLHLAIHGLA
jgi:uncharacterized membrane protein YfcA